MVDAIKFNRENVLQPEQGPGALPSPETIKHPEKSGVEAGGQLEKAREQAIGIEPQTIPQPSANSQVQASAEAGYKRIESILEEGMEDIYFKLPPQVQTEFKRKGEETIRLIAVALSKPKVRVKKIIDLIKSWLKIIPGVNRFFLEQTAKIKADKIIDSFKK